MKDGPNAMEGCLKGQLLSQNRTADPKGLIERRSPAGKPKQRMMVLSEQAQDVGAEGNSSNTPR